MFWLYVEQGRIKAPTKYGVRVSVWDAVYIHQLRETGMVAANLSEISISPVDTCPVDMRNSYLN